MRRDDAWKEGGVRCACQLTWPSPYGPGVWKLSPRAIVARYLLTEADRAGEILMDANVQRTAANAGKDDYRQFVQSLAAAAGFEQTATQPDGETLDFTDDEDEDEED